MEFWWWDIRFYRGSRSHAQKVEMKWDMRDMYTNGSFPQCINYRE